MGPFDAFAGRRAVAAVVGLATFVLSPGFAVAQEAAGGAIAGKAIGYELSAPVRERHAADTEGTTVEAPPRINPLAGEPDAGQRGTWTRERPGPDPLAESSRSLAKPEARLITTFDGNANPAACGGCAPPDTNGDVGRKRYIQMVNATKVAIFNKTGKLLTPIFDLGSLWSSGPCTGNAGDPIVVYDEVARRWVLSQFQAAQYLCFAISQTANPLGAYHLFTFDVGAFPDYFKVGVWGSGYYVSANEATYTAYAFDRAKMLAGDGSASFVKFTGETNMLLPADADGPSVPNGSGLFYTFKDDAFHGGNDRIELFRLTPDFVTPANSTFALFKTFQITPFTYTVCGFFNLNCASQMGTAQKLDTVSEWPMHRFAYRKRGKRKSLVGNFTVGGGSGEAGAAIRWFELRWTRKSKNWILYQEGTHDLGDGHDRFMGSIAMDKDGNIALGYSVSSSTMYPAIRYAVRKRKDARGTLRREKTLVNGGGSQTGTNRFGDYTAMSVDPKNGCRFWYTNEYYDVSSGSDWKTKIGVFKDRRCRR